MLAWYRLVPSLIYRKPIISCGDNDAVLLGFRAKYEDPA